MPDDAPGKRSSSQRWSETPWFWLLLFSGMALLALVAVNPKYRRRQGRLIRQFEARQQRAPFASHEPGTHDAAAPPSRQKMEDRRERSPAHSPGEIFTDEASEDAATRREETARRMERRSQLTPLLLLIGALFAVGALALLYQHRRRVSTHGTPEDDGPSSDAP